MKTRLVILSHDDAKTGSIAAKARIGRQSVCRYGVFQLWLVPSVFYLTFPLLLGLCLLAMGRHRTKRLIRAGAWFFADYFYLNCGCGADNLGSMAFSVTLIWRVNMWGSVQGVIWLRARLNG